MITLDPVSNDSAIQELESCRRRREVMAMQDDLSELGRRIQIDGTAVSRAR